MTANLIGNSLYSIRVMLCLIDHKGIGKRDVYSDQVGLEESEEQIVNLLRILGTLVDFLSY